MDLDRLFTVTDYGLKDVEIKTRNGPSNMTLQVWSTNQATTDYDLTGQILWPVCILLSHYVANASKQLAGKSVVELGAGGTGLPSLVAAHFADCVFATDGNGDVVLDLLKKNVENFRQRHRSSSLEARMLLWGNVNQLQELMNSIGTVDVVLAADVVQWPAVIEPLLHTVKALLWSSKSPHPVFILGIVNRASYTYDMFFRLAQELGFEIRLVPVDDYLVDGIVPEPCQEFGGPKTEILELTLKDRSNVPLLLQVDETVDMTKGSEFRHTSALPC